MSPPYLRFIWGRINKTLNDMRVVCESRNPAALAGWNHLYLNLHQARFYVSIYSFYQAKSQWRLQQKKGSRPRRKRLIPTNWDSVDLPFLPAWNSGVGYGGKSPSTGGDELKHQAEVKTVSQTVIMDSPTLYLLCVSFVDFAIKTWQTVWAGVQFADVT